MPQDLDINLGNNRLSDQDLLEEYRKIKEREKAYNSTLLSPQPSVMEPQPVVKQETPIGEALSPPSTPEAEPQSNANELLNNISKDPNDTAIKRLMDRIQANNARAEELRDVTRMGGQLGQSGDLIAAGIGSIASKNIQPVVANPTHLENIKSADKFTDDASKKNALLSKLILNQEAMKAKKENAQLLAKDKSQAKADKDEAKKEQFTQSLRKELSTGALKTVYSNVMNAKRAERLINDAIANPNGFKDFGILMGTLRSLQGDDSVIKDAERRAGENVGSIMDKLTVQVKKLKSGESLSENQRKMLLAAAKPLIDAANEQANVSFAPLFQQADDLGIPREKLVSAEFLGDKKANEIKEALSPSKSKEDSPSTLVKVKSKKTGTVKELTKEAAQKFLSNPDFEQVQ